MLDLNSEVNCWYGDWISSFPDSYCSLEFLNILSLKPEVPVDTLERLLRRCSNLKVLRVKAEFRLENLINLLLKAPQLVDLCIGLLPMGRSEAFGKLATDLAGCEGLKSLSGLNHFNQYYSLQAIYPACLGLTFLNLSKDYLRCPNIIQLLSHCPNLKRLWVNQNIEDRGLEEVAASCKELEELKVFLYKQEDSDDSDNIDNSDQDINLTERGLVSVLLGCPKLHSIRYICRKMTNATLFTVAKHRPNLTCLMINIHDPDPCDNLTQKLLDRGFSAIIKHCKNLKLLVICAPFTDDLLEHIGIHGTKLETLHLENYWNTDLGLHHVLSGCTNLRKLSLINCRFDGQALLVNSDKLERMQSLWMSSSKLSNQACELLRLKHPRLNVEVINGLDAHKYAIKSLYVYRTLAGPRMDLPAPVCNSNKKVSFEQLAWMI